VTSAKIWHLGPVWFVFRLIQDQKTLFGSWSPDSHAARAPQAADFGRMGTVLGERCSALIPFLQLFPRVFSGTKDTKFVLQFRRLCRAATSHGTTHSGPQGINCSTKDQINNHNMPQRRGDLQCRCLGFCNSSKISDDAVKFPKPHYAAEGK